MPMRFELTATVDGLFVASVPEFVVKRRVFPICFS